MTKTKQNNLLPLSCFMMLFCSSGFNRKLVSQNNNRTETCQYYAFFGNYLRLELLSRYGEIAQMVDETVKYFGSMVARTGAFWKNVHTRASLNHGFASHVAHSYYRNVLEAKDIDLVDKRICIEFNENNLEWCKGTMPHRDGVLNLSWEKKGNSLFYHNDVPANYNVFVKNNTGLKLKPSK